MGPLLLSGRGSGLMSPSRTSDCCWRSSTYSKKRERLIRPVGIRSARMRAGAIGDRASTAIATSGTDGVKWSANQSLLQNKKSVCGRVHHARNCSYGTNPSSRSGLVAVDGFKTLNPFQPGTQSPCRMIAETSTATNTVLHCTFMNISFRPLFLAFSFTCIA